MSTSFFAMGYLTLQTLTRTGTTAFVAAGLSSNRTEVLVRGCRIATLGIVQSARSAMIGGNGTAGLARSARTE